MEVMPQAIQNLCLRVESENSQVYIPIAFCFF